MSGERDAAHYIDNHYRDRDMYAVIHDLRVEVEGEVAQIDHLVIHRGLHFYLLESKNFNGDLVINDHGEFSVKYPGGAAYGIPSPREPACYGSSQQGADEYIALPVGGLGVGREGPGGGVAKIGRRCAPAW